jgi:hypothetical protein
VEDTLDILTVFSAEVPPHSDDPASPQRTNPSETAAQIAETTPRKKIPRKKAPPRPASPQKGDEQERKSKPIEPDSSRPKKVRTRPDPLAGVTDEQLDVIAEKIATAMRDQDGVRDLDRARADQTEYEHVGEYVLELFEGNLAAYQSQGARKTMSLRRIASRPALAKLRGSKSRLHRCMSALVVSRELQRDGAVPDPGQYFTCDDLAVLYELRATSDEMVALAKEAADEHWPKTRLHDTVRALKPAPKKTGQPLRGSLHDDAKLLTRLAKAVQKRPLEGRVPPDSAQYDPGEVSRLRASHEALVAWARAVARDLARLDASLPVGVVLDEEVA